MDRSIVELRRHAAVRESLIIYAVVALDTYNLISDGRLPVRTKLAWAI